MFLIDDLLGSLFTGVLNFFGNQIGGSQQQSYTQDNIMLQNQLNRENAEWQNQINIANWQMQNEYNHPAKQMERLKEAGLNPNLIYGNGTASTGLANDVGSVSHGNVGTVSGPSFGDMGMSTAAKTYIELSRLSKDNQLAQSQIDLQRAQANNLALDAIGKGINNRRSQVGYLQDIFKYELDKDTRDYLVKQMVAGVRNTEAQTESYLQSVNESVARTTNYDSQTALNIANIELVQRKLNLTDAETLAVYQGIKESAARIARIAAETEGKNLDNKFNQMSMDARIRAIEQGITESLQRTKNGEIEFDMKSFEASWLYRFGSKPSANVATSIKNKFIYLFK